MEGYVGPQRRRLEPDRSGITHKVEIDGPGGKVEGYIIANRHGDGSLGEVFLQGFGKQGSTLDGWVQLSAMLFSVALQYGAEFPMLARKISYVKFEPYGKTNNPLIPECRSVPDYIVRWLALEFGSAQLNVELERIHKQLEMNT
jgi:hypothetical protein